MGKAVTRYLTYAWIEYGDPRDGVEFTEGLFRLGWKNAMHGFPVKRDAFGIRYVDAAHPLLPIRFRGSGLLILPNDKIDKHSHDNTPNPPLNDPIFVEFRSANGEAKFIEAIREQNKFIAKWVFCPGLKRVSDFESRLTLDNDFTDYTDMVAISGHGASGLVWGGGGAADLGEALDFPLDPASDRLKYAIIASCFNVALDNAETWLPTLRRDRPVHGILGFGQGYPGDEVGQAIFHRFMNNLRAGGGSILKAWRDAHAGAQSKIWAALLHTSSAKNDTMKKWLARPTQLETPDKNGEVRWYDETNFPDGQVFVPKPPDFTVNFLMGQTRITAQNRNKPDVGLFPSQKGALSIKKRSGTLNVGDAFIIVFFYYRDNHVPGMNLTTLLDFGQPLVAGQSIQTSDGELTPLQDFNKNDQDKFVDALQFIVRKPGLSECKIPYTVLTDSVKAYALDRDQTHGYFPLRLLGPQNTVRLFYREGAWLREAKP